MKPRNNSLSLRNRKSYAQLENTCRRWVRQSDFYGLHPNKKAIPPMIITIRGNISNNNFKVGRDLPINLRIQGIPELSIPLMTSL